MGKIFGIELCLNHGFKLNKSSKKFKFVSKQIEPYKFGKMINKSNIVYKVVY